MAGWSSRMSQENPSRRQLQGEQLLTHWLQHPGWHPPERCRAVPLLLVDEDGYADRR